MRLYPSNSSRSSFGNSHPYLFKHAEKDKTHTNQYNSQNLIIFRYADLLLMLAEISNELDNGEQLGYVTEVLERALDKPLMWVIWVTRTALEMPSWMSIALSYWEKATTPITIGEEDMITS